MKISIIVPVYNVEAYIEDCLRSVAAQTYNGEIECIIVNDCTTDNSCSIIEKFIAGYNGSIQFTLLHHDKNRGLSAARNTGIDAATGEYVYFLDSDDEITTDCIELLAAPLTNKKYDFVIGDYATAGSDKEFPPLLLDKGEITTNGEIRKLYFQGNWYMMAWNKLCNLHFIKKHCLYFKEGLINEDELWSFQVACTAKSMYVVKEETYIYKIRKSSIIGSSNLMRTADACSTIFNEAYKWSVKKGVINNKEVFGKIIWFREYVFEAITALKTAKERKDLYIKCYKRLRIKPWHAYRHKKLPDNSFVKELYNYLPGLTGYRYLTAYNRIHEVKTKVLWNLKRACKKE